MTTPAEPVAGADAVALMRKRLARARAALAREMAFLHPLTVARFTGAERYPADAAAIANLAKLERAYMRLLEAEQALQ